MRRINCSNSKKPLRKSLRIDSVEISNTRVYTLVNQESGDVYYATTSYMGLKEMYLDFSYMVDEMKKVNIFVPSVLVDRFVMIEGVDYYF